MNKSNETIEIIEFIKSKIRERLDDDGLITIIELCKVIINEINYAIYLYDFYWAIPLEEGDKETLSLLSDYKWFAQKIINKYERFNETGQRGYWMDYFDNLRSLIDLEFKELSLIAVEGNLNNLTEDVWRPLKSIAIETQMKVIIIQKIEPEKESNDIKPQPKELQTNQTTIQT